MSRNILDTDAVTSASRRVLVVLSYPDFLRLFGDAARALRDAGFDVVLAFDKRRKDEDAIERAAAVGRVEWTAWAPGEWQVLLEEIGCVADYLRFMTPEFERKPYLRHRMDKFLPERFSFLRGVTRVPHAVARLVWRGARLIEAATPSDEGHADLLRRVQPDALIVSPVILRGPGSARQTQLVKTARRLGIPVAIAVGSWDHLSSKGLLRVDPDRLLVWNAVQRDEAVRYHGVRRSSVVLTGAHPWECWFERRPTLGRGEFAAAAGLAADRPYLLYVGSSRGIAEPDAELRFVNEWLRALRSASEPPLRDASVLIRPHPANWQHWAHARFDGLGPVAVWPSGPRNAFMRDADAQVYYHSIYFSEAVVGINTSAMIEATIIGRPVFSIRQPYVAQAETVHFEYLTSSGGGSTIVADSFPEHVTQLADALRHPDRFAAARERFLESFIRPTELGCLPLDCFVEAVNQLMALPRRPRPTPVWLRPLRPLARSLARQMRAGSATRLQVGNPTT